MAKKQQVKIDYDTLSSELKSKYDEYKVKFNAENILVLREEARKLLIPSFTTFAKNDLITLIVDKIIANYMSFDPKENLHKELQIKLIEDYRNSMYIEGEEIEGFLKLNATDGELLTQNKISSDIFVPQGLINEFALSEGDLITVKAEDISGIKGVFDVLKINGRKKLKERTTVFDDILPQKKNEFLEVMGRSVAKGGRAITAELGIRTIAAIVDGAVAQGYKTAVALLDEFPENVADITSLIQGSCVYALCDTNVEAQKKTATFMLNVAKRYAEAGQDVLLVVRNLDLLEADAARKVFGSARCFENGSLTVIAQSQNDSLRRLSTDII